MRRVAILQKYLLPYRVPLFNAIADHPDINLTLVYYGKREECRKATLFPEKRFAEVQCNILGFKKDYTSNLEFPISLPLYLRNLKPDVIICAQDLGGLISQAYAKLTLARYIIWSEATEGTEADLGSMKRRLRKLIFSNTWRFIVPGKMAEMYIKNFIPQAQIYFANNSVEQENFSITKKEVIEKLKQDTLQITFSGSLIEGKGIIFLIEGFRKLLAQKPQLRERISLRFLGTGPIDFRQYHDENITFAGFCEGQKYFDFMKRSHIFILPSLKDRNPLTVIEALFAGNIIIVSQVVGSNPEAVNGNGLVIQPRSVQAVYESLDKIVSLPRHTLTEMALQSLFLSKNFTTRRSAAGFLSAILN